MIRALITTVLALCALASPAAAQTDSPSIASPSIEATTAAQSPPIVGTWNIVAPTGPSVNLVQMYNVDGTMLSIHDEHPTRSTQLGVWSQIGERQFLMRNVSYRFDASGHFVSSIENRVIYTVAPDGATMTGRGIRFDLDLAGQPLGPAANWETRGTRLVPLPLETPLGS
jgi:hypothetical protein